MVATDPSDASLGSVTHNASAPAAAPRPNLPVEIWAVILGFVEDPYGLWVSCRRVSRMFKSEAKRCFRKELLPHFHFYRTYNYPARLVGPLKVSASLDDQASRQNPDRAYFQMKIGGPYSHKFGRLDGFQSEDEGAYLLGVVLDYEDLVALSRTKHLHDALRKSHTLHISFRDSNCFVQHINDAEISGIQIHLQPLRNVTGDFGNYVHGHI